MLHFSKFLCCASRGFRRVAPFPKKHTGIRQNGSGAMLFADGNNTRGLTRQPILVCENLVAPCQLSAEEGKGLASTVKRPRRRRKRQRELRQRQQQQPTTTRALVQKQLKNTILLIAASANTFHPFSVEEGSDGVGNAASCTDGQQISTASPSALGQQAKHHQHTALSKTSMVSSASRGEGNGKRSALQDTTLTTPTNANANAATTTNNTSPHRTTASPPLISPAFAAPAPAPAAVVHLSPSARVYSNLINARVAEWDRRILLAERALAARRRALEELIYSDAAKRIAALEQRMVVWSREKDERDASREAVLAERRRVRLERIRQGLAKKGQKVFAHAMAMSLKGGREEKEKEEKEEGPNDDAAMLSCAVPSLSPAGVPSLRGVLDDADALLVTSHASSSSSSPLRGALTTRRTSLSDHADDGDQDEDAEAAAVADALVAREAEALAEDERSLGAMGAELSAIVLSGGGEGGASSSLSPSASAVNGGGVRGSGSAFIAFAIERLKVLQQDAFSTNSSIRASLASSPSSSLSSSRRRRSPTPTDGNNSNHQHGAQGQYYVETADGEHNQYDDADDRVVVPSSECMPSDHHDDSSSSSSSSSSANSLELHRLAQLCLEFHLLPKHMRAVFEVMAGGGGGGDFSSSAASTTAEHSTNHDDDDNGAALVFLKELEAFVNFTIHFVQSLIKSGIIPPPTDSPLQSSSPSLPLLLPSSSSPSAGTPAPPQTSSLPSEAFASVLKLVPHEWSRMRRSERMRWMPSSHASPLQSPSKNDAASVVGGDVLKRDHTTNTKGAKRRNTHTSRAASNTLKVSTEALLLRPLSPRRALKQIQRQREDEAGPSRTFAPTTTPSLDFDRANAKSNVCNRVANSEGDATGSFAPESSHNAADEDAMLWLRNNMNLFK